MNGLQAIMITPDKHTKWHAQINQDLNTAVAYNLPLLLRFSHSPWQDFFTSFTLYLYTHLLKNQIQGIHGERHYEVHLFIIMYV